MRRIKREFIHESVCGISPAIKSDRGNYKDCIQVSVSWVMWAFDKKEARHNRIPATSKACAKIIEEIIGFMLVLFFVIIPISPTYFLPIFFIIDYLDERVLMNNGSIKKYSRASLSISGERCNVTATMPAHRRNMKLAIIPIARLTPRVFPSFRLLNRNYVIFITFASIDNSCFFPSHS